MTKLKTENLKAHLHQLAEHPWAEPALILSALIVAGLFANFVVKRLLLKGLNHALRNTSFGQDEDLRRHAVIPRLANIMPALVISTGSAWATSIPAQVNTVIQNVANAFIIVSLGLAISGILAIVDTVYHRRPKGRLKPIKGYIQIARLLVLGVVTILVIATLIDRSPVILLSDLGAMAAVLILVFQDTLLSLVAGIQISSNDMVRVGDWIEMPAQNADGDVIEISLHTVKVQNFDKTVTAIPIRRLVTDSFKNWRGMTESGGRRIKRAIHLDQNSVRFLRPEEITKLQNTRHLSEYLEHKTKELDEANKDSSNRSDHPTNARRLTNLGTFRAYLKAYLKANAKLRADMTLMVRQLAPGKSGIAIEVYCFTNTTEWAVYEDIQADIFDHVLAILPSFDLSVFQDMSGADVRQGNTPHIRSIC